VLVDLVSAIRRLARLFDPGEKIREIGEFERRLFLLEGEIARDMIAFLPMR
jgi:hypothetical protein